MLPVAVVGLEPTACGLWFHRSNQLNYTAAGGRALRFQRKQSLRRHRRSRSPPPGFKQWRAVQVSDLVISGPVQIYAKKEGRRWALKGLGFLKKKTQNLSERGLQRAALSGVFALPRLKETGRAFLWNAPKTVGVRHRRHAPLTHVSRWPLCFTQRGQRLLRSPLRRPSQRLILRRPSPGRRRPRRLTRGLVLRRRLATCHGQMGSKRPKPGAWPSAFESPKARLPYFPSKMNSIHGVRIFHYRVRNVFGWAHSYYSKI